MDDEKKLVRAIVYTVLALAVYTVVLHSVREAYEIPGFIGPAVIGVVGYVSAKKFLDRGDDK